MISGNIDTLNINGNITSSIGLDGNINDLSIDTTISANDISGSVSTQMNLETNINNELDIEAVINPITPATNDYERLINKPQINYVELVDNKTLDDLNNSDKDELKWKLKDIFKFSLKNTHKKI